MVSDRDILLGLFDPNGALAPRLTGEVLVVSLKHENGRVWHYATPSNTEQRESLEDISNLGVAEPHPADRPVFSDTPAQLRSEENATVIKDRQSVSRLANHQRLWFESFP